MTTRVGKGFEKVQRQGKEKRSSKVTWSAMREKKSDTKGEKPGSTANSDIDINEAEKKNPQKNKERRSVKSAPVLTSYRGHETVK